MQSFAKYNDGIKYLLNVIDVFSKYTWSIPLHDKTGKSMVQAFASIIKDRHPKNLWVDRGGEFYNRVMSNWLEQNDINMYSTYNEGKAVVIERFNRTLKTRMWKYMSAHNTHRYIDVLDEMIKNYNTSKHRSIGMTPTQASDKINENIVRDNLYDENPLLDRIKFHVNDRVRIAKKKIDV